MEVGPKLNKKQHNFEPLFDFTAGESSVLINECQAELCFGQDSYIGRGEVRLDLLPSANIYIYGYFEGVAKQYFFGERFGQTEITSFSINDRQIEGFRLSSGGDINTQNYNLKWLPKSEPINGLGEESTQIVKIIFHLFNFTEFIGNRTSNEQNGTTNYEIQHIDLNYHKWKVELKSLPSTRNNIKILKEKGGHQLTHVGGIERADGGLFSGKEAKECLVALNYFLTFAKGGWCNPVCAVGYDVSANRVWELWSSPRESWRESSVWFDSHNSEQLRNLFPLFMSQWENEFWCEALREIIYWYQHSNNDHRGIDTGIILTQTAIERLSYEYSVKDKRLLSLKGFKELRASDKFRVLFSSLGIPLEIPEETPEMGKFAEKSNWLDAPHALTEIRNSLVHPEHKNRGQLESVYYDAWRLGLWYLEIGILAICGYSGTYANRLNRRWIGKVGDVPWIKIKR
jgi:hypothetical protein